MKKLLFICLFFFASSSIWAQSQPYNVVFDLTYGDNETHAKVIRWINMILDAHPDAKLEVVFYGQSLGMVTKNKSTVEEEIKKLASSGKDVSFKVCEVAMRHHKVEKDQLIAGVQTVPDGIYEIITKEAQGYGYIKVVQ